MDKGIYEIKVVSHMKVEGHTEYLINIDNDIIRLSHIFYRKIFESKKFI